MATVKVLRTSERSARVTLARPERRNALNPQMAEDFSAAVAAMQEWGTTAVVLDAEGPAFCAGADLSDLDGGGKALVAILDALTAAPVHWTAKVRGAVRGAGLGLLAMCPAVLAAPGASFGMPELARGFFPSEVVPLQTVRLGARRAYELAFSALPIDAATACAWGLVSAVVADEELDARVDEAVERDGGMDPDAVRTGVRAWQAPLRSTHF